MSTYNSRKSVSSLFLLPFYDPDASDTSEMSGSREEIQAISLQRPLPEPSNSVETSKPSVAPTSAIGQAQSAAPIVTTASSKTSSPGAPRQTSRRGQFCRWLSRVLCVPDDSTQTQIQELESQVEILLQRSQKQAQQIQDNEEQLTLSVRQCNLERKLCQNERMECQDERHQIQIERERCQDTRRQLLLETKKAARLNKETEARHIELDNLMQVEQGETSAHTAYPDAALRGLGERTSHQWT